MRRPCKVGGPSRTSTCLHATCVTEAVWVGGISAASRLSSPPPGISPGRQLDFLTEKSNSRIHPGTTQVGPEKFLAESENPSVGSGKFLAESGSATAESEMFRTVSGSPPGGSDKFRAGPEGPKIPSNKFPDRSGDPNRQSGESPTGSGRYSTEPKNSMGHIGRLPIGKQGKRC